MEKSALNSIQRLGISSTYKHNIIIKPGLIHRNVDTGNRKFDR